jgi:DnaJ-class molecular chaperone
MREISEDLQRRKNADDVDARKAHFKKLCFEWHPDRNRERSETGNIVFQYLQEKKPWFLRQE